MKIDRRIKTTLGLLTCACALLSVSAKAATQDYLVTVNTSSLIGNANGTILYLGLRPSHAEAGVASVANGAARLGLICFDPQSETLRSS